MKIFFLNRFFFPDHSATSQLLSDLAFFLTEYGYRIIVITSRQRYHEPAAKLPAIETVNGVQVYRIWTTGFGRHSLLGRIVDYITFYIFAGFRLVRMVRNGDIVVSKTDPPLLSIVVSLIAQLRRAKQINWIQDLFPEVAMALKVKGVSQWGFTMLQRLRNMSLRTASINIVLSSAMADHLRKEKISENQIAIVHNWADGAKLLEGEDHSVDLRRVWNVEGRFVIGYSGNIGRAHDFETVLNAAERLLGNDKIVFLFIGDGAQRCWIQSEKERRGLNNVLFKPYQPQKLLGKSLRVPDVHIVSLNPVLEGFIVPSKFYGILAVGRPAIYVGDPDGEIAQNITSAECGAVVPPGEGKILMDCIVTFSKDRDLCKKMGENGYRLFRQRFEKIQALSTWAGIIQSNSQLGV